MTTETKATPMAPSRRLRKLGEAEELLRKAQAALYQLHQDDMARARSGRHGFRAPACAMTIAGGHDAVAKVRRQLEDVRAGGAK